MGPQLFEFGMQFSSPFQRIFTFLLRLYFTVIVVNSFLHHEILLFHIAKASVMRLLGVPTRGFVGEIAQALPRPLLSLRPIRRSPSPP